MSNFRGRFTGLIPPPHDGPQHRVSISDHGWQRHALQVAYFAVNLAAGKTAEQVAAAIAARVVESLRSKPQPEAGRREIAR